MSYEEELERELAARDNVVSLFERPRAVKGKPKLGPGPKPELKMVLPPAILEWPQHENRFVVLWKAVRIYLDREGWPHDLPYDERAEFLTTTAWQLLVDELKEKQ